MDMFCRLLRCAALTATVTFATGLEAKSPPDPPNAAVETSSPQAQAQARKLARQPPVPPSAGRRIAVDHSGRKQSGKASVYASKFQGRKMANGRPFTQQGKAAASKTLPLGTVAKVTNLTNGRTAVVTVEDRGPFVDGRTVDVSKTTATELGITAKEGVAPVVVAPIAVPQPNGTVSVGAGALPGPATAQ